MSLSTSAGVRGMVAAVSARLRSEDPVVRRAAVRWVMRARLRRRLARLAAGRWLR